ncbi:hypothetical protein L6R52_13105 [Myxococcota bacterium]|nr:hypothetical protein [Myxococcota bacterium]
MFRLSFVLAVGAAVLSGCVVEPRKVDRPTTADASTPDATAPIDAGADAGRSCLDAPCGDGEYCTDDGVCAAIPTTCETTSECAPGWACSAGRCEAPWRTCATSADCASREVCTAAGWCAPKLVSADPKVTTCLDARDCGPGGICERGLCVGCSVSAPCPRGLGCDEDTGDCVEQRPCASDDECHEGNTCTTGLCRRSTIGCVPDEENDTLDEAMELTDALYEGLSLCGDEQDYFTFDVPPDHGAIVTVTSTRASGTIEGYLLDANGSFFFDAAWLTLPGLSVSALPVSNEARAVFVGVQSLDTSAGYALDVRLVRGLCAGDALDLYGDTDPSQAVLVPTEATIPLVMCARDEDWVAVDVLEGDSLTVSLDFEDDDAGTMTGSDLDLELVDATGTTLALGRSTSTSTESASSGALAEGRVLVRVTSKRTPSAGARYRMAIVRTLGARKRACDAPAAVLTSAAPVVSGSLAAAIDVGAPFCGAYAETRRHDLVYRIEPPSAPSLVTVSVRQTSGALTSRVTTALLASCSDDTSVFACEAAPSAYRAATLTTEVASTDPLHLLVSSDGSAEDVTFELVATFEPLVAPVNDVCTAAVDLGTTSSTISASTWAAADDARLQASGVCGFTGLGSGPDRFYALSLAGGERAAVELRDGHGGFLWVATDCAQLTATCSASAQVEYTKAAKVVLTPVAATNYVVVVDGVGAGSAGSYELRTVRGPDLQCVADAECGAGRACDDYRCVTSPLNDACPGTPLTLTDGLAVVRGSTGAARDDLAPQCSAAAGSADVVYQVDVPAGAGALTARITAADWDPILSIRRETCSAAAAELACNDDLRFPDLILPEVTIPTPAAGAYFIVVDAYAGRGPFTLEVVVTP